MMGADLHAPDFSDVRREIKRCQRAVDHGSPIQYWIDRLDRAARRHEAHVAILRMQIAALEHKQRAP